MGRKSRNGLNQASEAVDASSRIFWKRVKLVGGAVLLLSFIAQNYYYSDLDAKSSAIETAIIERAIIDKGALLNEVLYFSANASSGSAPIEKVKALKIHESAKKNVMSCLALIYYSDRLSGGEKEQLGNDLSRQADMVTNYDSYLQSVSMINEKCGSLAMTLEEQRKRVEESRARARNIYLALYVIGSFMGILGAFKTEWS